MSVTLRQQDADIELYMRKYEIPSATSYVSETLQHKSNPFDTPPFTHTVFEI